MAQLGSLKGLMATFVAEDLLCTAASLDLRHGKTPMRTFLDSLDVAKEKLIQH